MLKKNANELGITVDGKNYVAFKMEDKPQQVLVIDKQNTKKQIERKDVVNRNKLLLRRKALETQRLRTSFAYEWVSQFLLLYKRLNDLLDELEQGINKSA